MPCRTRTIPAAASLFLAGTVLAASLRADTASRAWAPVPPMGWNSYDAFGGSVTEDQVLANASYMKERLLAHGWSYVVIDFRWYDPVSPVDDRDLNKERSGAKLPADEFGRLLPAGNRFPSSIGGGGFKPLADRLHAMGLKFGLHMMRGIPRQAVKAGIPIEGSAFTSADAGDPSSTCNWCPDMFGVRANAAGQAWYDSTFRLYASWGLDAVKVDDLSAPYHADEIEMIRKAIDKCGRPIVLSASPGPTEVARADHIGRFANMWRISGDFWDRWKDLNRAFDLVAAWQGVGGPGHWPDADMIPLAHIGIMSAIAGPDRWTRFNKDEQVALMSLWALMPSPLMLGANLPDNDDWTLSLITNDEVIAVDQDPLGKPARRAVQRGKTEAWIKELADGGKAVGLFNRGDTAADVELNWAEAGLAGPQAVRDLWRHEDLGSRDARLHAPVPAHGSVLLRMIPAR